MFWAFSRWGSTAIPLWLEEGTGDERSCPGCVSFTQIVQRHANVFKDSTHASLPYLRNEEKGGRITVPDTWKALKTTLEFLLIQVLLDA